MVASVTGPESTLWPEDTTGLERFGHEVAYEHLVFEPRTLHELMFGPYLLGGLTHNLSQNGALVQDEAQVRCL